MPVFNRCIVRENTKISPYVPGGSRGLFFSLPYAGIPTQTTHQELYEDDQKVFDEIQLMVASDWGELERHGVLVQGCRVYPILLGLKADWSYLVSWSKQQNIFPLHSLFTYYPYSATNGTKFNYSTKRLIVLFMYIHFQLINSGGSRVSAKIIPKGSQTCWWPGQPKTERGKRPAWDMSPL